MKTVRVAAAMLLAAVCAAQTAPATAVGKDEKCYSSSDMVGHRCYTIEVTNNSDKAIVGWRVVVDVVDYVGDKKYVEGLTGHYRIKPGKTHKGLFSYPYASKYDNARMDAVKFEDGTTWKAPEDREP